MRTSASTRPTPSRTLWLARGRHTGPDTEDVVRRTLHRLKDDGTIDDHLEVPVAETAESAAQSVFEARWTVADSVTVRARLTLAHDAEPGREWVLAAEAERAWEQGWPSPATMFWPDEPGVPWDRQPVTGLRLREVNRLPADDKDIRRLLRNSVRGGWNINVLVHEAMTPDERGRLPIGPMLPPSLRHRVVEHRAAPDQLRIVNRVLREFGVQVPRGGAVLLPATPAPDGFDADEFSVRTVFLDGSRPAELLDGLARFAALPSALPDGAEKAVTALRDDWQLRTLEEELARARGLVDMYAEALEAMTKSRDLYREAAERAHEALAAHRENGDGAPIRPQLPAAPQSSPFQQLTRRLERLKDTAKALRPTPVADGGREPDGTGERPDSSGR
ncbi:hypothetical protein GCM10022403_077720 [Streptomyces coacervatus]|uniref:PE-PGRS family protein n=1 Tax=Streptomyces coacervatus TaxID=647381 RepID=A0ABP7J3N1_9ACTN|nr:hypothetical protein [Streptomyces coacervatus]MDF2272459.1 hypothetical protein [Streptomyces coacervatus]